MVRIAISQAAFNAIAATLALGSTGYENGGNEKGERLIWSCFLGLNRGHPAARYSRLLSDRRNVRPSSF
jgi:hypothetical protein